MTDEPVKIDRRKFNGSKKGERRGGRQKGTPNKATAEIKEAARKHGKAVIAALAEITLERVSKDKNAPYKYPDEVRVKAGKELLDRGYGKATSINVHQGNEDGGAIQFDMNNATPEQLEAAAARMLSGLVDAKEKGKK